MSDEADVATLGSRGFCRGSLALERAVGGKACRGGGGRGGGGAGDPPTRRGSMGGFVFLFSPPLTALRLGSMEFGAGNESAPEGLAFGSGSSVFQLDTIPKSRILRFLVTGT